MPTQRSRIELEMLREEAERLVRAGHSRAEVARMLGVALTTLSQWALRHGWRRMDIDGEAAEAIRREVGARIDRVAAAEAERVEREAAFVQQRDARLLAMRERAARAPKPVIFNEPHPKVTYVHEDHATRMERLYKLGMIAKPGPVAVEGSGDEGGTA